MGGDPAQHFVSDPHWTWYIVFYFFLAGISGGSYAIAALLRLRGGRRDEPAARIGYYLAFPPLLICPILLILDLGQPLRFWHMVISMTPDSGPFMFKPWAPMSLGVYALIIFTAFAAVSFLEALVLDGKVGHRLAQRAAGLLEGQPGRVFTAAGGVFGLFLAGYTGVLLSVTNQPVWSNTWALGGLFLVSGLTSSAVLILFFSGYRADAKPTAGVLTVFERMFSGLELLMIAVFGVTVAAAGTAGIVFGWPWTLAWIVVLACMTPALWALATRGVAHPAHVHVPDLRPASVSAEEPRPELSEDSEGAEGAEDSDKGATEGSDDAAVPEGEKGGIAVAAKKEAQRPPLSAWLPPLSAVVAPGIVLIGVFMLRVAVILSIH